MISAVEVILLERITNQIGDELCELGFPTFSLIAGRTMSEHGSRKVGYLWLQVALGTTEIEVEVEQDLLQRIATRFVPEGRRVAFSQRTLIQGIAALALGRIARTHGARLRVCSMSVTPAHYQVALDQGHPRSSRIAQSILELRFACGTQRDTLIVRLPQALLQQEPSTRELQKITDRLDTIHCAADLLRLPGRGLYLVTRTIDTNQAPEKTSMDPISETSVESLNEMALGVTMSDEVLDDDVVVTVLSREQLRPTVRAELYLGSVELTLRQLLELRPGDQIVLEGLSLSDVTLRCGLTTVARGQIESDGGQTSIRFHSLASE